MREYRIKPVVSDGKRGYVIQQKGWLFWTDVNNDGTWAGEHTLVFPSYFLASEELSRMCKEASYNEKHLAQDISPIYHF